MAFIESVEALDRYTVRVDFNKYRYDWYVFLGYHADTQTYPPEMVEAGAGFWKNHVGTGPFVLADFVEGT